MVEDPRRAEFLLSLTKLELFGTLAALRAVRDSAPPGSPGEPLRSAIAKFENAVNRKDPQ